MAHFMADGAMVHRDSAKFGEKSLLVPDYKFAIDQPSYWRITDTYRQISSFSREDVTFRGRKLITVTRRETRLYFNKHCTPLRQSVSFILITCANGELYVRQCDSKRDLCCFLPNVSSRMSHLYLRAWQCRKDLDS